MTDDGEDRGALAGDGGKHSDKVKLALVNHVPNNPLVKAVHGLRNQMSLPPLDDDGEDESTPGKHERKELRSRSSNGESTGSSGVSPTGTDISSGTDSSPREEYARPSPVMKGASQSKRSDDTGESVTETSDVLDVLCEMAKERSAAMASSEGGLKGPCDAALRSSNKRSLEDGSMEDPPDAEEKGENERRLSFDSLSSYGGAGAVAKAAVGVGGDAATDASTSASSSMVTLEELSEEVLERDAKCAADASLQDAPLPKPHLRPPLPTRLTDTSNLDASQAEKQPMHMKSETDSDATPQGTTKISASEVRISEQQRKGISPLMIQQSSDNDDVGEAKDDGFEEEPISPTLRKIGKKIGRAGQKLGGGLAALRQRGPPVSRKSSDSSHPTLTLEDIEICQRLDEEYERALEEREVGWTARYNSVRQSACLSLTFMVLYLILGTLFFRKHTSWDIPDSLLFTIYTITTVGYGNHYLPTNPGFQLFVIFYIFVGIATLTILVAQVYQCIALEATRAQFSRDKADLIRRNNERAEVAGRQEDGRFTVGSRGGSGSSLEFSQRAVYNTSCSEQSFHAIVHAAEVTKHFLRYTRAGRGIAFILPFVGLILIGALVVGSIEGWTFVESIYFAVVSLTTVGFGDYYPTEKSSIYFCIFWLPFSVGFMSLYLGSVAHFYISLSNSNIQRMERRMRRRIKRAKEAAEKERQEAYARAMAAAHLNVESGGEDEESPQDISSSSVHRGRKRRSRGFATVPDSDAADEDDSTASSHDSLFGSPGQGGNYGTRRRRRILENASMRGYSSSNLKQSAGQTMTTMKDVLKTVKAHIRRKASRSNRDSFSSVFVGNDPMGPEFEFMSARSNNHSHRIGLNHHETHRRKPSFALRALVQERVAEIIACDIAGYQSHVEIKENTLRITIDTLKSTTEKWMIPRRARKAFRAVAFEVLYFVGEHGLITRGADALYDLTPFEFHGLFGPFLAAMGDADTMESWLRNTDVLADVELKRDPTRPSLASSGKRGPVRHMPSSESGGDDDDRSGTKWLSAKQTRKLDSVKERHLENASKIVPPQPPIRNSQGNAVSNACR